ncbi:hypothetical protein ACFQZO_37060 [Bradyrhizobium sp. GCM10027634]|uniref:hypothetical protein n=1 Tax=unclassified Bradyrhizobium TaxID=2631580 RepID=UPI00263A6FA2|nr:hypothetical protein [Bradyrhizobium sp. WYCCWR 12677]MDN5006425.1 hypothetical protein [Bradyrhizobium sp. WYCCWR 12677]
MNLRILKKQCKQAMVVLIAEHGYKPCQFVAADGDESVYAPVGMEARHDRNGFLQPGPLPGTPLIYRRVSVEYDEWDSFLPSEELRDIIHWMHFRPSKEEVAEWDAFAAAQNNLLAEGKHPFIRATPSLSSNNRRSE